jgi:hypothetical protein
MEIKQKCQYILFDYSSTMEEPMVKYTISCKKYLTKKYDMPLDEETDMPFDALEEYKY